ncbi:MAG: monovalent cation:proton antiporter-2 (CPA2) family protein [Methylobacterium sp.]|uniref:monovalent cation:proton antiporter-2 (CPA2) family protein n=1 Tax=Methylobacterium sp. TaxID=409 RepID=UPI00272544EA|nr:monovalent cation:proton antiporter-2 (CPA2) family protein [Methylobacterium sp.]MDO9427818.1 monovalent cation:proton antiporter-2 (CPA2) family protein [Methylobacterium sp.]
MAADASGAAGDLVQVVALLAAGVIAVPLFKRIGLGSVLGYLVAGLCIGPFGLGLFTDAHAILHVAELGVVMFLFLIGLEMEPSRLWGMRREIFGLGLAQVGASIAALTLVGLALGFSLAVAFVAGTGFVLTSTAIVMQLLEERGSLSTPKGQRIVAILLLEDLAIVPLLAVVAFLAPGGAATGTADRAYAVGLALLSVAALVAAGRWLLNPMFRLLAAAKAREVMTAAALLVVLGAALAMQFGGLSMAMGAFLAGVLLSESSFRHQLEADVEPFRGILLGLFFLGVGMSLDLTVIAANWALILTGVAAYMVAKSLVIYAVARLLRAAHAEAVERAALMAQGGEFAFVLYAAAAAAGIIDGPTNAILTATVILSMAVTPLMVIAFDRLGPKATASTDGVEVPETLAGSALIVGFGRFGQIVSQPLIARGCSLSIIDTNPTAIRVAEDFGFKVYYGDGARFDILHAAGAATARAILICIDDRDAARRIAAIAKAEFPLVPVLARARDREHAIALLQAGVAYQLRETLESALAFGEQALRTLGDDPDAARAAMAEIRRRDAERLALETVGGVYAGRELIHGNSGRARPEGDGRLEERRL